MKRPLFIAGIVLLLILAIWLPLVQARLDAAQILIVPNPYRPNDGNGETGKPYNPADPTSGIIFTNLAAPATIKISDMRGKRVRNLTVLTNGNFQWNVRDDKDDPVPSGSYSVIIRTPTEKVRKKLIIIR